MVAMMISSSTNYHWIKKITAHTNGGGVLSLTLHGDPEAHDGQFNEAAITIFTDNVAMTGRLIKAINGAIAEHAAAIAERESANA